MAGSNCCLGQLAYRRRAMIGEGEAEAERHRAAACLESDFWLTACRGNTMPLPSGRAWYGAVQSTMAST